MSALLLKDYYTLIKYIKLPFIAVAATAILAALLNELQALYIAVCGMTSGTISSLLISLDEKHKWNIYSQTMPFSKANYVSSKYIITLMTTLVFICLSFITNMTAMAFRSDMHIEMITARFPFLILICMLPPAIDMPFILAFGADKGSWFQTIIMILSAGLVTVVSGAFSFKEWTDKINVNLELPPYIIPVAAVIYAASWVISIAVYKRREI